MEHVLPFRVLNLLNQSENDDPSHPYGKGETAKVNTTTPVGMTL
jgi:hypothetical protein